MQIKQTSDYAIRIACYLAEENRMCSTHVLSTELAIPYNYIPKVTKLLKDAHIISASEGAQGGYQLLKQPWEISLWDILSVTEGSMKINNCLEDESACSRSAASYCMVHRVFQSIQSDMEYRLQSITVAELIGMKAESYTQSFYADIVVDLESWTYQVPYCNDPEVQKLLRKGADFTKMTEEYIKEYVEEDKEQVRAFLSYENLSQPFTSAQWQKSINYKRRSENRKGYVWMEMQAYFDQRNNITLLSFHDSKLVNYHMNSVEKKLEEKGGLDTRGFWEAIEYGAKVFAGSQLGNTKTKINKITELIYRKLSDLYPELEIEEKEIADVSRMSVARDLGKLQLPVELLYKKETLTEKEQEIIKMHPVYGAEILKHIRIGENSEKLYDLASDICLYHHERYDGNGYPKGLKGEEIPRSAQVVSLADAYEALVDPGQNQKRHTKEAAIQKILAGECGQFAPRLLHSFVAATADAGWDKELNK